MWGSWRPGRSHVGLVAARRLSTVPTSARHNDLSEMLAPGPSSATGLGGVRLEARGCSWRRARLAVRCLGGALRHPLAVKLALRLLSGETWEGASAENAPKIPSQCLRWEPSLGTSRRRPQDRLGPPSRVPNRSLLPLAHLSRTHIMETASG